MSYEKTGGPAFPTENERQTGHHDYRYEGMSLRDYFAAKAMVAYMTTAMTDDDGHTVAMAAYLMADEMLKARGQE